MHCFGFKKNVWHSCRKCVLSILIFLFFVRGYSFFPWNKCVSCKPSLFLFSSFPSGLLKYDLRASPLHSSSTPLLSFCSPMHAGVLSSVLYQISNFCRPTADCLFCWTWRKHGGLYCWSRLQMGGRPHKTDKKDTKIYNETVFTMNILFTGFCCGGCAHGAQFNVIKVQTK